MYTCHVAAEYPFLNEPIMLSSFIEYLHNNIPRPPRPQGSAILYREFSNKQVTAVYIPSMCIYSSVYVIVQCKVVRQKKALYNDCYYYLIQIV